MTERPPPRHPRLSRLAARAGLVASALIVFSSGYAAMMSDDWRKVTIVTLIGAVAGLIAAWFAKRAR